MEPASTTVVPVTASARLHILILDPLFSLPATAGTGRGGDLAHRLVLAGHRVSVLTTTAAAIPLGAARGLDITALPTGETHRFGHDPGPAVTGAYARALWLRLWSFKAVDAVIAVAPPFGALTAAQIFCKLRGAPLILDVRVLPPLPPAKAPLMTRLCAWAARLSLKCAAKAAQRVLVAAPAIGEALASSLPAGKVVAFGPGCDTALFNVPKDRGGEYLARHAHLSTGPLVVYAGALNAATTRIVDLAAACPELRFVLCGDGPARADILSRAQATGVLNRTLWLMGPLPRNELPDLLAAATVVLAVPRDAAASGHVFDALAAGRPVVLLGASSIGSLIESRGAGLHLPGDTAAAARELLDFLRDGDGVGRAGGQATAMAAGGLTSERINGEARTAVEHAVSEAPRLHVQRRRTLAVKRLLDFIAALKLTLVLLPVMAALALIIRIKSGGIFVGKTAAGRHGTLITPLRFRTDDSLGPGLQAFLKRTRLDALPGLIDVVLGRMSLVGPQPLPSSYVPNYDSLQRRRLDLRPGLTGWAQVNQLTTWENIFAHDTWYVENVSLGLDLRILGRALLAVLRGDGRTRLPQPAFDDMMARREGAEDV